MVGGYHSQGVAVAVSNKLTPMIIEVTPANERIMRLRIRHSLGVISLVSVYAPTEVSDLTVKDAFHITLEFVVDPPWVHLTQARYTSSLGGFQRVLVPMGLEL